MARQTRTRQPRTRQPRVVRSVKTRPRPVGIRKKYTMRPGNRITQGQVRNPRAGGSSEGGPRNRTLNRDRVLGSPKIQQKGSRYRYPKKLSKAGLVERGTQIKKMPGRIKVKMAQQRLTEKYGVTTYNKDGSISTGPGLRTKRHQQRLSDEYDITTYNLDGTVSTSPDYGEGEIR